MNLPCKKKPYQVWELDGFPNKGIAVYDASQNISYLTFIQGQKVTPPSELQFLVGWVAKPGLALDFWPNTSHNLLAGPRGVAFLQEFCPEDIQLFDARIHCKDQVITDYKFVNLTHESATVDEARSECIYFRTGDFGYFEKFLFKENSLNGHYIVREMRMHSWMICSKEFVEEYKKRKLKGLQFTTDDAYRLPPGQTSFRKDPPPAANL